jgi:acyl dehydratase
MSNRSADTTTVTADLVATLVTTGGYTHPLFDPPGPETPLPGQGVLLLLGGLAERSGELDDAIAMLELRKATFHRLVRPGTTLRIRIERLAAKPTSGGKVVQELRWTGLDDDGDAVAEVEVVMLMKGTMA